MSQLPSAEPTIRMLIVDDHEITREGIRTRLERSGGIVIIDEAASGEQALDLMQTYAGAIDVVLMDIDLPGLSGIGTTRLLIKQWPDCKVLLLSGFTKYSESGFAAGAMGYVLKKATGAEIITAIRTVWAGKTFMSQPIQDALVDRIKQPLEPLTAREYEILADLGEGLPNARIAEKRHLSENTVRDYVSTILKKLAVENRTQAVALAIRRGLLP